MPDHIVATSPSEPITTFARIAQMGALMFTTDLETATAELEAAEVALAAR